MGVFFEVILQMSLTASFVIAAVLLVRLLLRRAPRRYSYVLWLVVLIRLVCPTAPAARFGAVPDPARIFGERTTIQEQVPDERVSGAETPAGRAEAPAGGAGAPAGGAETPAGSMWIAGGETEGISETAGGQEIAAVPDITEDSIRGYEGRILYPKKADTTAGMHENLLFHMGMQWVSDAAWRIVCLCWLCGCLIFLCCGIGGYLRLIYRMHRKEKQLYSMEQGADGKEAEASAVLHSRHIRILEDSGIGVPFTAGVVRPVICLPKGLLPFQREMVLAHESIHIRRRDNLFKLIAYAVRCIHWFNPLVWLAFRCFEEDMEISCDEAVLNRLGYERRKDYAKTLLALSECQKENGGFYSVSFGRRNTKSRIRNVLAAKKTKLWVALVSMAAAAGAAVILLVNHEPAEAVQAPPEDQAVSGMQTPGGDETVSGAQASADGQTVSDVRDGQNLTEAPSASEMQGYQGDEEQQEQLMQAQVQLEALQRAEEWEEELRRRQAEWEAQIAESGAQEEALADQQEIIDELEAEMHLSLVSAMLAAGGINEGETHLEESLQEEYRRQTDRAYQNVSADGACALLCNPQTGLERNGRTVGYTFPLDGIEDGSVRLTGDYGCRIHPVTEEVRFHSGIDLAAEKGTPIYAAAGACVYRTGFDTENGNYVILIHANGELTYYAHCDSIDVEEGDIVDRGQQIATVGSTGNSTGPHLHFAVSRQGAFVPPFQTEKHTLGETE